MPAPSISVIVNTYNRAESLRLTLAAMEQLDAARFELIVVDGPSTDGTEALLDGHPTPLKRARCPHANLAESRNIGVAIAAGEVVAFIDDDAYPDPAWLVRLGEAYATEEVAAAGGPVYDHTGYSLQARYSLADRLGVARIDNGTVNPTLYLNTPFAAEFPYTIGTNSSFRRSALLEIGGFDEEFEYYLEETDACLRLIDRGLMIRLLDDGYVYHKFLPSEIRTAERAIKNRFSVLKNTFYFALKHELPGASGAELLERLNGFIEAQRADIRLHIARGNLETADAARFETDLPRALETALRAHAARAGHPREAAFFGSAEPFLEHPLRRPAGGRLTVCLLIQEWPPVPLNGIARVLHTLARGLAAAGHVVHVLTRGEDHDRVDLEEGVWVHRVCIRPHIPPADLAVPPRVWDYSASLLDELRRIDAHRAVDIVQFPNWDSEGIAALLSGRFRTVVGLYTPLKTTRAVDPLPEASREELDQLERLEQLCYERSDLLLACGPAIVAEVEERYAIHIPGKRLGLVPHALEDVERPAPSAIAADGRRLLFVGRLEPRKGIDVLLACVPGLLAEFPDLTVTIIGRDTHLWEGGKTARQMFEASVAGHAAGDRVHFLGLRDDGEVLAEYARCDVFVAPSRFESFGLILLEAMRVGKPVVASRVGGMTDIVEDGVNGILVPPGDADALGAALERLLASEELRREYGRRSRELFEERYSVERMVSGVVAEYRRVLGEPSPGGEGGSSPSPPAGHALSRLADRLTCPRCRASTLVAARAVLADGRAWSGVVRCPRCGVVGTVANGKLDFEAPPEAPEATGAPAVLPIHGERRLDLDSPELRLCGRWERTPDGRFLFSEGSSGQSIHFGGRFTGAAVRLFRHHSAGLAEIRLDGKEIATVDLFQAEGSVVQAFPVADSLPMGSHTVAIRALGTASPEATGTHVFFEELVLYGPIGSGEAFRTPAPINRGNSYDEVIERLIAEAPEDGLILEIGGGDRRRSDPRLLNFELLPVELADAYGDVHALPFADATFSLVLSQAVFEHLAQPFQAAEELIRVTRPGGLILTEVAFMQPLHAVPSHFFNMTTWGVEELFRSCEIVETDWFGELSTTVEGMLRGVGLEAKVPQRRLRRIVEEVRRLDPLVSHDELRSAASGVYVLARKRS